MKQRVYRVYPFIKPPAFPDYDLPPTIYSILKSFVYYDDTQPRIKDLATSGRENIFDFDYPLSENVDKEDFEVIILNHFLMRRIGYDTVTSFKIALNVKLNEIMPMYNKMFDALDGWDLFNDGERITETGSNTLNNTTSSNSTSDRRYSDTPQNQLANVQNGSYITDYNYDTDVGSVTSNSAGSDSRTITRTPSDKMKIYKEFIENKKSIYTMIFEDLDSLFYGLV